MLTAMPSVRMLAIIPDATPNWRGVTLPMIAVEFGVMKRPNPAPIRISSAPIPHRGVSDPTVNAGTGEPGRLDPVSEPPGDRRRHDLQ